MESLPEELFKEIALYLQLSDILSCCLVCKIWRNLLNDNRLWQNLYEKRFRQFTSELPEKSYLGNENFDFKTDNEDLMELCVWRIRYIKEMKLWDNWTKGNFHSEIVYETFNRHQSHFIIGDDNVVMTHADDGSHFRHWDIQGGIVERNNINFSVQSREVDFYKLWKNHFIIVQGTVVQVFDKLAQGDFVEKDRFIFHKCYITTKNIPPYDDISIWYSDNIESELKDHKTSTDYNGQYFIGTLFKKEDNEISLHIWDINKMLKISEVIVPKCKYYKVTDIKVIICDSKVFIKISYDLQETMRIICYCLDSFSYTKFDMNFSSSLSFYFSRVFIVSNDVDNKLIRIWSVKDNNLFHTIPVELPICPAMIKFQMPLLLTIQNSGGIGHIKVIDVTKLETYNFSFRYYICNVDEALPGTVLVAFSTWHWESFFQLMDYKTWTQLCTFNFSLYITVNFSRTKLLVGDGTKLCLFHFW